MGVAGGQPAVSPASLALHDELPERLVHVVEAQGRHFGGAQAERASVVMTAKSRQPPRVRRSRAASRS